MEQWNDGILGPLVFHLIEKLYGSWDKQTPDRIDTEFGLQVLFK